MTIEGVGQARAETQNEARAIKESSDTTKTTYTYRIDSVRNLDLFDGFSMARRSPHSFVRSCYLASLQILNDVSHAMKY
jgi:hypothetical protein